MTTGIVKCTSNFLKALMSCSHDFSNPILHCHIFLQTLQYYPLRKASKWFVGTCRRATTPMKGWRKELVSAQIFALCGVNLAPLFEKSGNTKHEPGGSDVIQNDFLWSLHSLLTYMDWVITGSQSAQTATLPQHGEENVPTRNLW